MSWLQGLPLGAMAIVTFGITYLMAALIYELSG
jgi:hypothetical protein